MVAQANRSIAYDTVRRVDARLTSKVIGGVSDQAPRAAPTRASVYKQQLSTQTHVQVSSYVRSYTYVSGLEHQLRAVIANRQT